MKYRFQLGLFCNLIKRHKMLDVCCHFSSNIDFSDYFLDLRGWHGCAFINNPVNFNKFWIQSMSIIWFHYFNKIWPSEVRKLSYEILWTMNFGQVEETIGLNILHFIKSVQSYFLIHTKKNLKIFLQNKVTF